MAGCSPYRPPRWGGGGIPFDGFEREHHAAIGDEYALFEPGDGALTEPQPLGHFGLREIQGVADAGYVIHGPYAYALTHRDASIICADELGNPADRAMRMRMNIFADNVRFLREPYANQTLFAEAIGVTQGTVSRWEKEADPKAEHLLRLSEVTGYTVDELLTRRLSDDKPAQAISMRIAIPQTPVLAAVFEALLFEEVPEQRRGALALKLAQRLPSALARATDSPPVLSKVSRDMLDEVTTRPAIDRKPRQRESRT